MSRAVFHVSIGTVEGVAYEGDVEELIVPTLDGEITILPKHMALMSALGTGAMIAKDKDGQIHWVIDGGILQIKKGSVSLLTELAERAEDIDEARVEEARKRAVSLKSEKTSQQELLVAEASLRRELARLKVARRYKKVAT